MKKSLFIIGFLCVLASTARAQLFLEEGKVVLAVEAKERVRKVLMVHNTSNEPISVKAYWEDFEYQPPFEGSKSFMPAGTSSFSASRMVSFSPSSFTLPAYGKLPVDYTVSAPEDMSGGKYGTLFFEKTGDTVKTQMGLSIVTRVGCLFFIEPKNKNKTAEVSDIAIEGHVLKGQFKNRGNIIQIPRMTYDIMNKEGMVADRGELKKHYVPPQADAAWEASLSKTLPAGSYTMLLNTDLDEGDVIVKEIELLKDESGQLTVTNVRD